MMKWLKHLCDGESAKVNVAPARDRIEDIHCFLDNEELTGENSRKLKKALDEFDTYVVINEALIPNYGERWRNEEAIATGFVESAVNQIVSKRFAKKQQMQWTKKSAHLVLQMRTQVLDERLEETFRDWYPDFRTKRLKHPLFYALHACAEHLGRSLRSLLARCR